MVKNPRKVKLFISYNHKDIILANLINSRFIREKRECDIFMDEHSIDAGESIPEECQKNAENCDVAIIIYSENAVNSFWVPLELGIFTTSKRPVIFVSTSENIKKPPEHYGYYKMFELWKESDPLEGIDKLLDLARETIGQETIEKVYNVNDAIQDMIGYNPPTFNQMHLENNYRSLVITTCGELTYSHKGWDESNLDIRMSMEPLVLNTKVREIIKECKSLKFSGTYAKFQLIDYQEWLTDEPKLKLIFQRIERDQLKDVVDAQCYMERIKDYFGSRFRIFDVKNSVIPHFFGLHLVLITSDDYLLLCQRSSRPYWYKTVWSVSCEEQLNADKDVNSDGICDLWKAAKRGIKEELIGKEEHQKTVIPNENIRFHSLFRELDGPLKTEPGGYIPNVNMVGIVKLETPFEHIWNTWRDSIKDKPEDMEFKNIVGIKLDKYSFQPLFSIFKSSEFNPIENSLKRVIKIGSRSSIEYLKKTRSEREWHPSSKLRILCILRKYFCKEFENEIRKIYVLNNNINCDITSKL